jgi:uncharacterized protein (TIGR02145 family)
MKTKTLILIVSLFVGLLSCQKEESVMRIDSQSALKAGAKPVPRTKCAKSFKDLRDKQVYDVVQIGSQCWMARNLAYIPEVNPSANGSDTDPYYYVYGYEGSSVTDAKAEANYTTYGVLYNQIAASAACPSGWHLPSQAELTAMTEYLGVAAGGMMKEAGTSHWDAPNTGATNSSGFTGLPGGSRGDDGGFYGLHQYSYFWSSTAISTGAWFLGLTYDSDGVQGFGSVYLRGGFSVRCVQN